MSQPNHIAIACGGTGGHLFPGLALAEVLVPAGVRVTFFVSEKAVDGEAVRQAGDVGVIRLGAVGFSRSQPLKFLWHAAKSWKTALGCFRQERPEAVVSMGGFTSVGPVLAGRQLGIGAYLHESNAVPGRANRWLAPLVHGAFVGFPCAARRLSCREVSVTGTPVRSSFRGLDPKRCRGELGLHPAHPVLLVMGGSQGARALNRMVLDSLVDLKQRCPDLQCLHLTGQTDYAEVRRAYAHHGLPAKVHTFLDSMPAALGASTIAISRAGASTLAELAALRLPSIVVPLPHATDDHQRHNAREMAATGAVRVLEQEHFSPRLLATEAGRLLDDSECRAAMQSALAAWDRPECAAVISASICSGMRHRPDVARRRIMPRCAGTDCEAERLMDAPGFARGRRTP